MTLHHTEAPDSLETPAEALQALQMARLRFHRSLLGMDRFVWGEG